MINDRCCAYLFHHTPPLGFEGEPLLLLSTGEGKVRSITLKQLARQEFPIVTHSFSLLVDWFRTRSLPLPRTVVDLEIAQKLLIGRPKSDFDIEKPWDMPSMFLKFVHPRYNPKNVRAALATHLSKPPISDYRNLRWMTAIAAGLPILWREMQNELERKGEKQRFFDVEVPAYNAMLGAQYRGIHLDQIIRDTILLAIEDDYISAHHELAIVKGIDVERALGDVRYLNGYLANPIEDTEEFNDTRELIKAQKDFDETCAMLYTVDTARRNRSILLRCIESDEGRCYPLYDTMGTVTGRILAVDPLLQHLNKKYRRIIKAGPNRRIVYLDYSQFEPNIMASISNDPQLLTLCNEGDLYQRLAVDLCGNMQHRKALKLMYLSYSYGKKVASLSEFLTGILGTKEDAESVIQNRFLPLFAGIEKWKSTVEDELSQTGRIGTLLGNYRYKVKDGDLDAKERRWAISQVVQGTGSLILKKLIIMLTNKLPEAAILLPMYDALLLEIPEDSTVAMTNELLNYCRKAFQEVCPLVSPSVCEKSFAET